MRSRDFWSAVAAVAVVVSCIACGLGGDEPDEPRTCGITSACRSGTEFCQHPTGSCGTLDGEGTCVSRPTVCPSVDEPVCGCDGKTYANACTAQAAGVSVETEGRCGAICEFEDCGEPPPVPGLTCPDGTVVGPTIECLPSLAAIPGPNGGPVCEWSITPAVCPGSCSESLCGPRPPLPGKSCADGTQIWPTVECGIISDHHGIPPDCGWQVEYPPCPDTCTDADCGALPPIAPPPVCADGSQADVTIECNLVPGAAGPLKTCAWDITYGVCPDICPASDCGPRPPDRNKSCADGTQLAPIATECRVAGDALGIPTSCSWQVEYPPCPEVCADADCGPPPPLPPPLSCADGSQASAGLSCDLIPGALGGALPACGWTITAPMCPTT